MHDVLVGVSIGIAVVTGAMAFLRMAKKKTPPHTPPPTPRHRPGCSEDDLSEELFFVWRTIMASLADVHTALGLQTQAIADLAGRIPVPGPPPAATEADLDAVKASIDTNTASVAALAPPPTP
jgi:hypothetical protein